MLGFIKVNFIILVDNVDIDKIQIYDKFSFNKKGYKYFIGYKDDDYRIKQLLIMLLKMSKYIKRFDKIKYMLFY